MLDENIIKKITKILLFGGIGVLPTDTIYGIVGSALNSKTVENIYFLRKRNLDKPMIILISSFEDLSLFGIKLNKKLEEILKKNWPGKISFILDCKLKKFKYLHRGKNTLAFRFPNEKSLLELLKKTGPLVAPSANFEGSAPSEDFKKTYKYFGDKIDFYVDFGKLKSKPSTIVKIKNKEVIILREGADNFIQ